MSFCLFGSPHCFLHPFCGSEERDFFCQLLAFVNGDDFPNVPEVPARALSSLHESEYYETVIARLLSSSLSRQSVPIPSDMVCTVHYFLESSSSMVHFSIECLITYATIIGAFFQPVYLGFQAVSKRGLYPTANYRIPGTDLYLSFRHHKTFGGGKTLYACMRCEKAKRMGQGIGGRKRFTVQVGKLFPESRSSRERNCQRCSKRQPHHFLR